MEEKYLSTLSHPPLDAATDAIEEMDAVLRYAQVGRCLNGIMHDVNNYLGAIMAYAELILNDEQIGAESRRMLEEIVEGARKCEAVIAGLAEIARKAKPAIAAVDPVAIVQRVLHLCAHEMRHAGIRLKTRFEEISAPIVADRAKLQTALLCLVMNAQEALAACPQDRLIRVSIRPEDDGIAFEVWNSGPPPSPEMAAHMFEPFMTSKRMDHFCLGLSYAREVAELHGGSLSYAPYTGFTLRLPAKSPLPPQGDGPSV